MSPGVNFTRKSADRIASTVHTVERSAPVGISTQRKRGGGLGRSSLWEVTAVQTTPKTVTLQRVDNPDMDLVTVRDREDIYYDPDAEPVVGDRGLVIRLGDGSLFFFRHRGGNAQRISVSEYSKVDDSVPDTTVDYKDIAAGEVATGSMVTGTVGGAEQRVVLKWPKKLSGITTADVTLCIGKSTLLVFTGFGSGDTPVGITEISLVMTHILEDFTASTLTWNNLSGLSMGASGILAVTRPRSLYISGAGNTGARSFDGIVGASGILQLPDLNDSYGLELKLVANTIPSQFTTYQMETTSMQIQTSTAFISWLLNG